MANTRGPFQNRPYPKDVVIGTAFYATDQSITYRNNGSSWDIVGAANYTQGLDANRPAAGYPGSQYYSTDTKTLAFDLGDFWIVVGSANLITNQ